MASKTVRIGDLLGITAAADVVAVAKVVYLSRYFKNVMGLRVFDRLFSRIPTEAELPADVSYLDALIYTGRQAVGRHWPIIGHRETSDEEVQLTRRLVAGDVYVGDDNQGRASDEDRRRLRSMDVAGMYAVHDELIRRLSGRPLGCT